MGYFIGSWERWLSAIWRWSVIYPWGILHSCVKWSTEQLEPRGRSACFPNSESPFRTLCVFLLFLSPWLDLCQNSLLLLTLNILHSYFDDFQQTNGNRNIASVPESKHAVRGPIRFFKEKKIGVGSSTLFLTRSPCLHQNLRVSGLGQHPETYRMFFSVPCESILLLFPSDMHVGL